VGASGWEYVTAYQGTVADSVRALQQRVFDEEFAQDYGSLEELWADEEFMGEEGTHTVIDVYRLVAADERLGPYEHYNTIRPLADDRLEHHFGTTTPTPAQYQAAIDHAHAVMFTHPRTEDVLIDEADLRWTARCVVLYTDGKPTHLGVFGSSGD
jgi:hypothetical protein